MTQFPEKQQEIDRLNAMAADARNNLDVHRQQALASRMADLDCQERFLAEREKQLDVHCQQALASRMADLDCQERFLTEREKQLKENQAMLDSILHAEHADTPYFAKQFADCLYLIDLKAASDLENKARPAFTAAEKVREISSQKRALQEQCKLLEYQLFLYESVFPWLSDFKEISADDLASVANIAAAPESEYSTLKIGFHHRSTRRFPKQTGFSLHLIGTLVGKKAIGRLASSMNVMSVTVTSKKVIRFAILVQLKVSKIWTRSNRFKRQKAFCHPV